MIIHENLSHPLDLIGYLKKFTTRQLLDLYIDRIDIPVSIESESAALDHLLDELTNLRHEFGMDKHSITNSKVS